MEKCNVRKLREHAEVLAHLLKHPEPSSLVWNSSLSVCLAHMTWLAKFRPRPKLNPKDVAYPSAITHGPI